MMPVQSLKMPPYPLVLHFPYMLFRLVLLFFTLAARRKQCVAGHPHHHHRLTACSRPWGVYVC